MNKKSNERPSEIRVQEKMKIKSLLSILAVASMNAISATEAPGMTWSTVVNNTFTEPDEEKKYFFSYNQPSINNAGVVVFRARAKAASGENLSGGKKGGGGSGSGEPTHGIFSRDMSYNDAPIVSLAISKISQVPEPNNQGSTFIEFPAFPRIDANSNTTAFRSQSAPTYEYITGSDPVTGEPMLTKAGTSGVYVKTSNGSMVTGASQLGSVSGMTQYQVPIAGDVSAGTRFDQFPGAPSPDGNSVAFKGNFTNIDGQGQTGVYYRNIAADNGNAPVVQIARSGMDIPIDAIPEGYAGDGKFGSTAPPSAADGKMVFTGLDVEAAPKAGGIFLAEMIPNSHLTTVASFNTIVPNNGTATLSAFGEGLSFDGRYVGFWGGWGSETFTKTVSCSGDGNQSLVAACISQDTNGIAGDGIYSFEVLKNQGIFLVDTLTNTISIAAQTGVDISDFLFWNFSGKPPEAGESEEGDNAEPPRWRSSAFVAIDGDDVVFKALNNLGETGLYAGFDVNSPGYGDLITLLETGSDTDGGLVDPDASGLPIATLGIERDGFRNGRIAINASMTDGENSQAGIYVAKADEIRSTRANNVTTPEPGSFFLLGFGIVGLAGLRWRGKRHIGEQGD